MKKILLLLAVVLATLPMSAADVSTSQAQAAASAFLTKQVKAGRLKASAASNLQLVKAEKSVAKPTAVDYYIFNSTKSYVVVSGDDLAPQILMYGEEGSLDVNNIPPAMQWLLNKYKFQIDGLKAGTRAPVKLPKFATSPVAPLVTANWDQSAPYYNQCPTSGSRRALTGCPATSMAMNYYRWKWPETYPACAAIDGSTSGGFSASALPERAADWDNIIDEYTGPTNYSSTSAQKDAVAWLMRYAGQSMPDYMYGTSASGANDPEIYQGVLNMGYTDAQYLMLTELLGSGWNYYNSEQYYTDEQWNEWMLNELHNGRPIEYLAYDSGGDGGHAFNVFGVNASGQYYVNWGWSGDSNGYCTLHNFTTATGSTGGAGAYVFNWGEAMIIGIEPPAGALTDPRITVNPTTLTMNTTVGTPVTATFQVTGANLTGNINLSVSGNNAFSLSTTSISATQAENGVNVTVTYNPSAVGTHEATVTLTSTDAESVTVKLNGIAEAAPLETYPPVMLDATNITSTSFTATWTDQTPAENVESYTLYVSAEPFAPAIALLDTTDWTANNNIPTGWSQYNLKYWSYTSACYLSSSDGYVQSKTYDLTGYDKMTVMIYAQPYDSPYTMTIETSVDSKTITMPSDASFAWYTFVVNCASNDYVKLTTGSINDLRYMKVYAGDASPAKKASETGDATYRVITGITSKNYTVNNLTEGGTFNYYVVANYVNGTIGNSNINEVTLSESTLQKETPIMLPANEEYINLTQFRADWTHGTPAENVESYTLEVNAKPVEPEVVELIGSINGTSYTNQSYQAVTLSAPWSGNNVYGGYGAIYFRNATHQSATTDGYIKFTIPAGYQNKTFTLKLTTGSGQYGSGSFVVGSTQTAAVEYSMSESEAHSWLVTGSTGEVITITSPEDQYSPDIAYIEVYAGDATAKLNATETGNETYRLITGITDKFYTVEDLTAEGTFLYKVKALYIDGTESNWSNIEEVTLFQNGHGYDPGDVNHDGKITIGDISALIDILLGQGTGCEICADVNVDGNVTIGDVSALIDLLMANEVQAKKMARSSNRILNF